MSNQKYILSNNESLQGYATQSTLDLLWPCDAYTISLLAKGDEELNPFEKILLILINNGIYELAELQSKVGFNQDLVEFICHKLEQLGLIDQRRKITPQGSHVLDKFAEQKGTLVSATIYYDLINKQFLPIITKGRPSTKVVNNKSLRFSIGTLGKEEEIKPRLLEPLAKTSKKPSPRDIIEVIRRFHKTNKRHSIYLPQESTITVNSKPLRIYLHNQAFICKGDHHVFVTNGFNSSISPEFSEALKLSRFSGLIGKIKDEAEVASSKKKNEVHGNTSIGRTLTSLYNIKGERDSIELSSPHAVERRKDATLILIKDLYFVLEQIFFQLCFLHPTKDWQHYYYSVMPIENGERALEFANHVGFETNTFVKRLLSVSKGRLHYLFEVSNGKENADMSSVLAMVLLAASIDKNHSLCELAKQNPRLLVDIATLRSRRNPLSHSDQHALEKITDEEIERYWQIVQQLKEIIMPNVSIKNTPNNNSIQAGWQDSDARLRASNELEKEFGFVLLKRINDDTCHSLQRSLVCKAFPDGRLRVDELTGALQSCLYQASTNLDTLSESSKEIKQLAEKNIEQDFPDSLLKTDDGKVKNAAKGVNSSLGANFITFCARNEAADLQYLNDQCPNMATDIAEIIQLRGHAGEILNQQAHTDKLAKATFHIIKVLAERYCD